MKRRTFLHAGAAALASPLAAPALAQAPGKRVLTFVPQADIAVLDPVWTTTYQTRDHGFLVFDTLFGLDGAYRPQPQMAAGASSENDGRAWKITLRDGLKFHDGEPVLARDAAASIRRWGARDGFGQALIAATDAIEAPDDKTIVVRLKHPFPLLPDALAKTPPSMCPIMPERLAATDPFKQVTEMVGSGPYRYKADERVPGAQVVYERFDAYVPRADGTPDGTSGPKVAHFDRIEWRIMPDPSTVSAALQRGEDDRQDGAPEDRPVERQQNPAEGECHHQQQGEERPVFQFRFEHERVHGWINLLISQQLPRQVQLSKRDRRARAFQALFQSTIAATQPNASSGRL
ncbi:MAG: hypothetical protein J0H57_05960 [Rhodospirillales bacterium]|nr:hypothetical protein [Rhodospirillales bacterium]